MTVVNIGKVIAGDIQKGIIRVHLKLDPEKVYVGMPCIIKAKTAKFYCIVTNLIQNRDDMTMALSFNEIDINDVIGKVSTNLERPEAMEVYADVLCLKILYDNGERRSFKTIPNRLSQVVEATQEDIEQIYVEPLKNDTSFRIENDPETATEYEFDTDHFAFGHLSSNRNLLLPIRMDKIVQRPLSVVGMTGSGKTVTIKNIILRIINDHNRVLNTRMIIFDVQNEYIVRKHGRKDPGIYEMLPDKVRVITLDPENCRKMNIHDAERFRVFEKNINVDDVISILSGTNLTEKMTSTLHALYSYWYRNKNRTDDTFYDKLMRFYNDPEFAAEFDSEGSSYSALRRRLRIIARSEGILSKFIVQHTDDDEKDTIDELLDQLQTKNPSKKSYIIHFGKYGKSAYVYEFIANLLGRRIYNEYSEKNDLIDESGESLYDQCVILLEEAHKFIKQSYSENVSIFNLIAREMRKYGLTLFIVDQMPSKLDTEIMAQVNNRIIHRLSDVNDIKNSLSGLQIGQWASMVSNLEDGESLCFGAIVEGMPTIIKSFYGSPDEFRKFHGIKSVFASSSPPSAEKKESESSDKKKIIDNIKSRKLSPPAAEKKANENKNTPIFSGTLVHEKSMESKKKENNSEVKKKERVGLDPPSLF